MLPIHGKLRLAGLINLNPFLGFLNPWCNVAAFPLVTPVMQQLLNGPAYQVGAGCKILCPVIGRQGCAVMQEHVCIGPPKDTACNHINTHPKKYFYTSAHSHMTVKAALAQDNLRDRSSK